MDVTLLWMDGLRAKFQTSTDPTGIPGPKHGINN